MINYISRESQTTRNVLWSPASVCLCVCLCVCLSGAARPHYCTDQGSGRDYSLVVHHWADLQSVHGFRCCSPKPQFWGREWAFSSQTREIKKHACHRNYCIDSNQILHSDKDLEIPSWVVQTCASQIQDGGQPPSWKNRKIALSQQQFDQSPRNLAQRHILILLTLPTIKILKI